MKNANFNFFVPLEIEKANNNPNDPNRYKNMILSGVASTSDVDSDNEVLEPSGFDLSILRTKGLINYEHGAKRDPSNNIGEPIEANIKDNQLVIKAKLWKASPMAQKLWDTLHVMKESESTRVPGWSIEGQPIQRDPRNPKRITKALITNIAFTFCPKNGATFATICKSGIGTVQEELDYDIPENVDFLFKGTYGVNEYTLHKDFTITKSMCAGSATGQALIGQDTSGAALKQESLDDDLKVLTIPISTIMFAADNWKDFQKDTKKAIQKGLHDQLEKARGGVYKNTAENRKKGVVGQKYGEREQSPAEKMFRHTKELQNPHKDARENPNPPASDEEVSRFRGEQKGEKKDKVMEHYREATKGQNKKISLAEVDRLFGLCEYSKKPYTVEDIEQTKITDELRKITDKLPVIEQSANFLRVDCPKEAKGKPYIAEVKGSRFLCDPQGYDYPRYITKLVNKITPVE
jgi:hypothetical protein